MSTSALAIPGIEGIRCRSGVRNAVLAVRTKHWNETGDRRQRSPRTSNGLAQMGPSYGNATSVAWPHLGRAVTDLVQSGTGVLNGFYAESVAFQSLGSVRRCTVERHPRFAIPSRRITLKALHKTPLWNTFSVQIPLAAFPGVARSLPRIADPRLWNATLSA